MYNKVRKRKRQERKREKKKKIELMLIVIEKLLLRCPYFFRLENILGDRPDVRPPAIYDSGTGESETTGVEGLLRAMVTPASAGETRESPNEEEANREEEVGEKWEGEREEREVAWRGECEEEERAEEEWPEEIGLGEGMWEIGEGIRIGPAMGERGTQEREILEGLEEGEGGEDRVGEEERVERRGGEGESREGNQRRHDGR